MNLDSSTSLSESNLIARPPIRKVVFRRGFVSDPKDWRGLKKTVLEEPGLPRPVVEAILDNDLLAEQGTYGIPEAGDPVEVISLQITHGRGLTEVTVYNLGIMLFHTNDHVYPRVLRVCWAIEKYAEESDSTDLEDEDTRLRTR